MHHMPSSPTETFMRTLCAKAEATNAAAAAKIEILLPRVRRW